MTATVDSLDLVGNRLCLDFVNTVNRLPVDGPVEFLTSEAALSAWAKRSKLAVPRTVSGDLLKSALVLRKALYAIFYAVAHSAPPPKDDLETLKTFYLRALKEATLEPSERFSWKVSGTPLSLLHTLTLDALDLLQSNLSERIGYCQNEDCNWLFLDTTRSRTKRWCSAAGCGNRARVKRFLEKGG